MKDDSQSFWLFAYGSLVWRPNFEYTQRLRCVLSGWSRRFWQGSTDHRGLPGAPGRVATVVPEPDGECWGVVYRLSPQSAASALPALDIREQGGYVQREVSLLINEQGETRTQLAHTYIALPGNSEYLGPAPLEDVASQIRSAHGPSGSNREYLLRLAEALAELGVSDDHVAELARLVRREG